MLEISDITYAYRGIETSSDPALKGVSLHLSSGERIGILGHNGSGKSTLLRIAALLESPVSGTVSLDGIPYAFDGANGWEFHSRVGYVGQDPDDQMVASTVFEEVAFGPCNLGMPRCEIPHIVEHALDVCNLSHVMSADVSPLSGGQRQRLAVAGVLATNPSYILCDEPCSMLDPEARRALLAVLDDLAAQGTGICMVTHEFSDIQSFDRMYVLEQGKCLWEGTPEAFLQRSDIIQRSGCLMPVPHRPTPSLLPPKVNSFQSVAPVSHPHDASLTLSDVSFSYDSSRQIVPVLSHIDLVCAPHRICLVCGCTGSGKSTLLRLSSGMLQPTAGTVRIQDSKPSARFVSCSFQRPEEQLFAPTVLQDVAFGPRNLGHSPDESETLARAALARVDLDSSVESVSPFSLSGGQMRRVALAGVLAMQTPFVLFDEPAAGLDAFGLTRLLELLQVLRNDGRGVVVVTHDMDRMLPVADDVVVLDHGQIAWMGSADSYRQLVCCATSDECGALL